MNRLDLGNPWGEPRFGLDHKSVEFEVVDQDNQYVYFRFSKIEDEVDFIKGRIQHDMIDGFKNIRVINEYAHEMEKVEIRIRKEKIIDYVKKTSIPKRIHTSAKDAFMHDSNYDHPNSLIARGGMQVANPYTKFDDPLSNFHRPRTQEEEDNNRARKEWAEKQIKDRNNAMVLIL